MASRSLKLNVALTCVLCFGSYLLVSATIPSDPDAINAMCGQNRCSECVVQPECGWCASSFTCMYGNATGPQPMRNETGVIDCADKWVWAANKTWPAFCQYDKGTAVQHPSWAPIPHEYDVICANGGERFWMYNEQEKFGYGSSNCSCPAGWEGMECRQCTSDVQCGSGQVCSQTLLPYKENDLFEHRLSCGCRGTIGNEVCNIELKPPGVPHGVHTVLDYNAQNKSAFVRTMTAVPEYLPWHLMSGIVYAGHLKNCVQEDNVDCPTGSVYGFVPNRQCATVTCEVDGHIYGPGPGHDCNTVSPTNPATWRYRSCLPQSLMDAVTTVLMTCQYGAVANAGTYTCAFDVPHLVGPLPMTCTTGTCIDYEPPPPPPPPTPKPPLLSKLDYFVIILAVPFVIVLSLSICLTAVIFRRKRKLASLAAGASYAPASRARVLSSEAPLLTDDHVAKKGGAKDLNEDGQESKDTPTAVTIPTSPDDVHTELPAYLRGHTHGPMGVRSGLISEREPDTVFSFANVKFAVRKKRNCSTSYRPVLRGVAGVVPSQLFALMGPSGCGKTTLLDILAGRKSTSGGTWSADIKINGVTFTAAQLRHTVGYIMQDDVLMGTMGVREYLLFQTTMRCSPSLTDAERYQRVEDVLRDLGLQRIADSKIGDAFTRGISGGEKRRVSIAAELITDPKILVVDEPTSGLDSANAKSVVDALARVARCGRVVIMSIHQPRSYIWSQFGGLLLLGKKGQVLYCGDRDKCIQHFRSHGFSCPQDYNPADFLLDMVAGLTEGEAERLTNAAPAIPESPRPASYGTSSFDDSPAATIARYERHGATLRTRMWELSLRTFMNVLRNPLLGVLNYGSTIIVSVLTGLVFHHLPFNFNGLQDRLGLMFFAFLFFSMTSLSSLGVWREERLLFLRERASGVYTTTSYFFAKVFCDIVPLRVLPPIIFSACCYWAVGLSDEPKNFLVWTFTVTLVNILAASLCLAVGALIPNLSLANLVASLILLFTLLLAGLLSHNESALGVTHILQRMSFLNYAFEILANNEFIGQTYNLSPVLPGHAVLPAFPATGETVILTLGLELDEFKRDLSVMLVFFVVFLCTLYLILEFAVKERR